MASNILKPIGFILILGAVAAGAYYFGKASGPAQPVPAATAGGTPASDPAAGQTAQPGVAQQVTDWIAGAPATAPAAGNPEAPAPARKPEPIASAPRKTATSAPRTPHKTVSSSAPSSAASSVSVGDAVPTTVTALAGDWVLTRAKAKVRLLGVNTPADGIDGARAREALAKLLGDGAVKIQLTADRTAAVVWKDGRRINESMVRLGWSRSSMYPVAEAEAKRNRDGLWSPEGWMGP